MNFKSLFTLFFCFLSSHLLSQRGKDGNYTASGTGNIVNTYTFLNSNAIAGSTTIVVGSNVLSGGAFAGNLAAGDLVLIIQMQGATIDVNTTPTVSWGGTYTVPDAWITGALAWGAQPWTWGQVTNYNTCGKFEMAEVRSVSGTTNITLNCGLQNSYTIAGKVQVVRVPRFNNLTLNASSTIVPPNWNGTTGGIVAVEVNGNLVFNTGSKITANTAGFRGGSTTTPTNQVGFGGTCSAHTNGTGNGSTQVGSSNSQEGARKGEGIGGYVTEYDLIYSGYGRGAPGNGGGGGGYQNCGGGGGCNVGVGSYTGKGVPSTTFANSVWNLESAGFGGSSSPGGGRGGYSVSNSNQNASTAGPNNTAWCNTSTSSDARKENGGFGGHPLNYDATRIFMGGGGGAGDQDQTQGGSGGTGGGIVFLTVYGTVSGTGTIDADGGNGINTNPTGSSPPALSSQLRGNDGAGGGGGGGSIFIKNSSALPSTLTLSAKGGNGGNQVLSLGNFAAWEAAGPGGAGGGGSISFSSGTPVQNVSGGTAGTTNSDHLTEFNMNGATNGAPGLSGNTTTVFNLTAVNTEVCAGQSASFSVTSSGTLPGVVNWYASAYGGSSLGTGLTYTPAVAPTVTTTYYAGICPGTFRVPVTVTINPLPVVSGTAVLTNPTCSTAGSITGLAVSAGTSPYQYYWNGVVNPTVNYTNLASGTYSFTVTDAKGCTATSGPYTLTGVSGPIIDASGVNVQNVNCVGDPGSITGITATGTGLNYLWDNGGGSSLDASGLIAGSYTLTVTDANSCTSTSGPYTVNTDTGPTIDQAAVVVVDEHCGQSDGSISGIVATGSSLSYSWNGSASTTADFSGVSAGTYTLTVTDAGGCTVSGAPISVSNTSGPTIDISSVIVTYENCTAADGAISGIVPSGGTPSYTYSWSGVTASTLDVSGISAGVYSITVTDFYGCTVTSTPITVGTAPGPSLNESSVVVTDVQCDGTLGTISGITASGTNLTYSWTNSGGSTLDITGLLPNTYVLTATDQYGCSVTSAPYTVGAVTPLLINSSSMTVTPTACTSNTGSISGIVVLGGISPSYSWSSGQSSLNISSLAAGDYTLTVSDNQGCSATLTVTIEVSPNPTISLISSQDITCNGSNDGTASVNGSGGTGTLSYSWQPGSLTGTTQSSLLEDAYTVTVSDQNGCTNTVSFTISEPTPIVLNQGTITPATCGASDGSASVSASGGTGVLDYFWSPLGGNASTANAIPGGNYTVTVTDDNSCTASLSMLVNSLGGPVVSIVSQTDVSCNGGSDGSVAVNSTGGTAPYQYNWSPSGGNQASATALAAGTYTVVVTDDGGCVGSVSVTIDEPSLLTVSSDVNPTNCGLSTGSITVNASGGTSPYSYAWLSSGASTASISGLPSGTYSATITDALGCTVSAVNNVLATGSLTLSVTPDVASITPGQNVTLTASGADSFVWSPETGLSCTECASTIASPSETTSYTLVGTTADGCTGSTTVQVIVIEDCGEVYVPTVFAPNGTSGQPENQRFGVFGQCISSVSLLVFDRWGNKVYEYSVDNPYWDGKYKGEELNSGVYVYQLSVTTTDQKTSQMSGNVTLMR